MRVLLNTLTVEGPRTGIGHYTGELLRCLRRGWPDVVETFPPGWLRQARAAWARHSQQGGASGGPASWWNRIRQTVRESVLGLARSGGRTLIRMAFREAIRRGAFDLYHEPNFIPFAGDLPTIATVHDLSVILHPEWHPTARVAHFEKHFLPGLKRCVQLLAISECGKSEIVRHLGWPAEKVSVTYMGVRQGLQRVDGERLSQTLKTLGLKAGYLLHVGTLEPRKNVLMLLKAYCDLPASVREKHPLVLVGGKGWNVDDVHVYLNDQARHKGVRWLGYVEEKHFAGLYSGARALVFPTLYEGFGMPTVEMFATGGAVLASTAVAVAETAGSQAHLIHPHDLQSWRDSMFRVCSDHEWWLSLREGAEQAAAPFTWEKCAERTFDAYCRIATTAPPRRQAA
ncbi:MAG: glycosyltransferase family 4 protein [Thermomicrobiales bacterium]